MSLRSLISKKLIMPVLLRFSDCPPWPWYKELLRLDRADRDEIRKCQWDKFRSLVEHAQREVRYYTESFGQVGVGADKLTTWEDLLAIPTISKRQIAANFPDRITSRKSNRDTWQYFATSGTTDRLMVIKDTEATSRNIALTWYEELMQGTYAPGSLRVNIPPDACSLACAAKVNGSKGPLGRAKKTIADLTALGTFRMPRFITGQMFRNIASPMKEMPSFGPEGTRVSSEMLQWYVERIRRWQPRVLSGLPTYLQLLGRYIERTGELPLSIGSLLPQGALSTPGMKKELTRAFNVPVHEVYGGHEFGCVASTCEQQDRLHIMMSECLVETVRNGKHAGPGELGEIVVTTFINRAMPLIRYRPGDVGRLYEDTCSCGRKSQLLVLEGRMEDTLITSKGIRTEKEIIDFLMRWPNIEFAQLVQRSETRCDLLVVEKESGGTDLGDLSDAAREFLGEEIEVRPRLVSTIKPEVSGKFRFVKSTSFEHFHESTPMQALHKSNGALQTDQTISAR